MIRLTIVVRATRCQGWSGAKMAPWLRESSEVDPSDNSNVGFYTAWVTKAKVSGRRTRASYVGRTFAYARARSTCRTRVLGSSPVTITNVPL